MACSLIENVFENSLHYSSPAHGGWGVLKTAQLIPESYFLFISPAACGRHGAVGAKMEGRKDRVSYMFLSEESIVSGDYEDELVEGVNQLLSYLEKRNRLPKVMGIFVSCIDDLLGTDHDALTDRLSKEHPGLRFIFCKMNPTSTDTGVPPLVNVQNKIYITIDKNSEKDKGVNLIGNLAPIKDSSELYDVLEKMGVSETRHITKYDSHLDYQDMGKSRLNIVVAPSAKYAADNMQEKHDIPYIIALTAFRKENIKKTYLDIAKALGVDCPDLSEYETIVDNKIDEVKNYLNNMPIILDDECVTRPFEFARSLLENGFNVIQIYSQQVLPTDKDNYEWIIKNYPNIIIKQSLNPKVTVDEKIDGEFLAIGYSAGYLSKAKHVVDISGQHGLYGYKGLVDLLDHMKQSSSEEADLKKILDDAVIIV